MLHPKSNFVKLLVLIPSFRSSFILFFCKFYCACRMFSWLKQFLSNKANTGNCVLNIPNKQSILAIYEELSTHMIYSVCLRVYGIWHAVYIFCNNRNVCLNKTKPSLLAACYGIFSIHYNCIISFYEDSCCQTYSVIQNRHFYILFCRIIHEVG